MNIAATLNSVHSRLISKKLRALSTRELEKVRDVVRRLKLAEDGEAKDALTEEALNQLHDSELVVRKERSREALISIGLVILLTLAFARMASFREMVADYMAILFSVTFTTNSILSRSDIFVAENEQREVLMYGSVTVLPLYLAYLSIRMYSQRRGLFPEVEFKEDMARLLNLVHSSGATETLNEGLIRELRKYVTNLKEPPYLFFDGPKWAAKIYKAVKSIE